VPSNACSVVSSAAVCVFRRLRPNEEDKDEDAAAREKKEREKKKKKKKKKKKRLSLGLCGDRSDAAMMRLKRIYLFMRSALEELTVLTTIVLYAPRICFCLSVLRFLVFFAKKIS